MFFAKDARVLAEREIASNGKIVQARSSSR